MKRNFSNLRMPQLSLLLLLILLIFGACKKENFQKIPLAEKQAVAVFPATSQEKEIAALTKEIGTVLEEVYLNHDALNEVNAAI